jgi:hypothetical protein
MLKCDARQPVDADVYIRGTFLSPGYRQIAAPWSSGPDKDRVVIFLEHFPHARNVMVKMRVDTELEDVINLLVQYLFGQSEGWYLAPHKAAALFLFVVKVQFISQRGEIPGHS